MKTLKTLETYTDSNCNEIIFSGKVSDNINIVFRGTNNKLVVSSEVKIGLLHIQFDCDNGRFEIGTSKGGGLIRLHSRVGQDSEIRVGANVSMTGNAYFSAVEGTRLHIGNDVMFASGNQIRTDDAHPIFDVRTGRRINPSKNITIGSHVWFGNNSAAQGGADIGNGSVIGAGAMVNKHIPNNCIAIGTPARVVRKDIAWERPHLSLTKPYYKPDSSTVTKSEFWNLTDTQRQAEPSQNGESAMPYSIFRRLMKRLGYVKLARQ